MKKVISLFIVICMILSAVSVLAEKSGAITITINGITLEIDTEPYIKNDRTMVPMRAIFEALGAEVSWDDKTKTAIGVKDGVEVKITIGENVLYKNGEAIELDYTAEITNDRTMVPVRAISEAFGATVSWDNENRIVKISTDRDIKVIRIGTHAISEDDPNHPQCSMSEDEIKAAKAALEKVKATLGVEIEFVEYTSDYKTLIGQSIEEGNPFCHLATLWGGSQKSAIEKGILQPIDDYKDIFEEEFPLVGKTDGHYYFMSRDFNFLNAWPIVYNISMLDKIPELKEDDGTTLYPAEMYYRGEWTWSGFENYLSIIKDYCKNYSGIYAPVPFETNYTHFAAGALHSVGEEIYDGEKISAGTDNALKAVEFAGNLFEKGLVTCETAEKNVTNSGWLSGTDEFIQKQTFFTNCAPWKLKVASDAFGGNLGIVPFPQPDGELVEYRHINFGSDSVGLVKGIDEETSRLALMAYKAYKVEYCKLLANVTSMAEFWDKYAAIDAESMGIDVKHPEVGTYHARLWAEYGKTSVNEYSEAFEQLYKWSDIFGKYAFDHGDINTYRTNIENMNK